VSPASRPSHKHNEAVLEHGRLMIADIEASDPKQRLAHDRPVRMIKFHVNEEGQPGGLFAEAGPQTSTLPVTARPCSRAGTSS
jgi:hypothetical protein